jgi:hypothetical protein
MKNPSVAAGLLLLNVWFGCCAAAMASSQTLHQQGEIASVSAKVEPLADAAGRFQVAFQVRFQRDTESAEIELVAGDAAEMETPSGFALDTPGEAYHAGARQTARASRLTGPIAHGRTVTVPLRIVLPDEGRGYVALAIKMPGSEGASLNVYVGRTGRKIFSSTSSASHLKAIMLRVGALESPRAAEAANLRWFRSGAQTSLTRAQRTLESAAGGQTQFVVSGQLRFTDRDGGVHAVRGARVEVHRVGAAASLGGTNTDDAGRYEITVSLPSVGGTAKPLLVVRATAQGIHASVRDTYAPAPAYAIDSSQIEVQPADESLVVNLLANNQDANNLAFGIYQAVEYMASYVASLRGTNLPQLTVRYPRPGDSSSYNGEMQLGDTDAHDWDNIHHEYGHHVQRHAQIGNNPGGAHVSTADLCEANKSKSRGIALAYGEAWPTVFAIIAQRELGLQSFGISSVGDTRYTDRQGSGTIDYDIATDEPARGGEGRERSLIRAMWQLYGVAGARAVWAASIKGGRAPFHAFWSAMVRGRDETQRMALGRSLARQRLAALPLAPSNGFTYTGEEPLRFEWNEAFACQNGDGLRYSVLIIEDATGKVRWQSSWQRARTLAPIPTEVSQIMRGGKAALSWTVLARDTNSPQTGDYYGPAQSLVDDLRP